MRHRHVSARAKFPTSGGDDVDLEVRSAGRLVDHRLQSGLVAVAVVGEHQQPATIAIGGQHRRRLLDLELTDAGFKILLERGTTQYASDRSKEPASVAVDTEGLTDGARMPVCGDQIIGAERIFTGITFTQ